MMRALYGHVLHILMVIAQGHWIPIKLNLRIESEEPGL